MEQSRAQTRQEDSALIRERFTRVVKASGMSILALAKRAQVPRTTIYSYVQGHTERLMGDTQQALAVALDTTVAALFTPHSAAETVPLCGVFGGRGIVQRFDAPLVQVALPPGVTSGAYVAYEVGELHMPPAEPGWIALFKGDTMSPADAVGMLGLVELSDSTCYFRRLRRGYDAGRFNLEAWDGSPPLENRAVLSFRPFVCLMATATRL